MLSGIMTTPHALQVRKLILSSMFGGTLLAGCASSGTEPHAMTAGQHDTKAGSEEKAAAEHQGQYNRSLSDAPTASSAGTSSACISYERSNCNVRWRSEENPTEQHRKDAELHRKLAEKHRAASQTLREAEQRFCSGIPVADRDLSPFYHREDITRIDAVKEVPTGNEYPATFVEVQAIEKEVLGPGGLLGARITFRAVQGMTAEWLQRVVDCHLARNEVVGAMEDMSFCPLAVPHATAVVSSTGSGFSVDVTADRQDDALEIVRRARSLGATGPAVAR